MVGLEYVVGSKTGKKKVKGKRGKNQGSPTIKYRLELVRRTNDRHLNSHWRPIIEAWQANRDIQLIVDCGKVAQYMTKYVTKSEPSSTKSIIRMMKKLLKNTSEDSLLANTVLKRTVGKVIGERMISQQEIPI